MTKACIAIIIIVLISSYICTRNGYKNVGNSILPVALVPTGHIIGTGIVVRLMKAGGLLLESAAAMSIATAVDVAACVAGCALVMAISKSFFKRKATRRIYISVLSCFMGILTLALLINYYNGF